ncbi:MAG: hypothetical protein ACYS7M_13955, partial [Planctomycetota bacterium]
MTRDPGGERRFGPGSIRVAALVAAAVCALLAPGAAIAQCPPVGTYPATWPSSWTSYTSLGDGIEDETSSTDESYGTPPSVAWVDIYNGDSGGLPSLYWSFDSTNQVMFFRQRLRGDPRQHSGTDDYSQFTWTTNLDLDGDGFSDFLVQVNGFDDEVQVLYDADGNNVFDDDLCSAGGDMVFATATTTTTQYNDVSGSGAGHLLDWQLPLCAFSDCDGLQIVTETTPFSLTFTTSTNQGNPALKDGGFPGDYKTAGDRPLPGGDPCSIDGTCTERPYIGDRSPSCSGSPTDTVDIVAKTLDALVVDNTGCTDNDGCVVDTIANVKFEYKQLGTSDPWVEIATVTTPDTNTLNSWSTSWDVSGLDETVLYWVRITVTDDDGNTNSFDPDNDGDVPGQFSIDLRDCSIGSLPVSLAWVDSEV